MTPGRLTRAVVYGGTLAFLVAGSLGPPDPFSQLALVAVALPLFVAGAYVSVAASWGARTFLAFLGAVLVAMLVGSAVSNALHGGTTGRAIVLAFAVVAGALVADRIE